MTDPKHPATSTSTTAGLPLAPSMEAALRSSHIHRHEVLVNRRTVFISVLCLVIAVAASWVAEALSALIGLITHFSYYGDFSTSFVSPAGNALGLWAIGVPVIGGLIVGLMARYGSQAIRGHGIPEAMEKILFDESKIPARLTILKPISAAIAIGTGGPFGAEGPIIATGGALGSLLGQVIKVSASERKTLLAAGAAAGMTATFGSPIAAVLLAVELLLFEFRPRSFVPVALASTLAAGMRFWFHGALPVFSMPNLSEPSGAAIALYLIEGALMGAVAVGITRAVYAIEDAFDHLPIHWMWWPALGALVVGVVGVFSPHTLGVGYDNIEAILSGKMVGTALFVFCILKFISWSIALGSGTSGGTLAPLFTIGGGLGACLGQGAAFLMPTAGVDPRVAGLVGMAATFSGASRALLASIVFAFEITHQPLGLVPLLGGCTASFLVSALLMKQTIMTEKIARRGREVPSEYLSDALSQLRVMDFASPEVVTFAGTERVADALAKIMSADKRFHHQGFPVIDGDGNLIGLTTRRCLVDATVEEMANVASILKRPAVVISPSATLRTAANIMIHEKIGRLPVVDGGRLVGIITRKDVMLGYSRNVHESISG